jgi:predicted GH43/DUF377 family glycosyl hydrolase
MTGRPGPERPGTGRPGTEPGLARHAPQGLRADPGRVVARLFLPGEELPMTRSRAAAVVARVLALPEAEVEALAAGLLRDFAGRHPDYPALLADHASIVGSRLEEAPQLSTARALLLGACFTAEYAVEGAALCNPSAVLHPDQTSLQPGQARAAVSLRGIGEGHYSSIGFCTAVLGPGPRWSFEPRTLPAVAGVAAATGWRAAHLRAVLADRGQIDELASTVLSVLPLEFTGSDLERVLADVHPNLLGRPGAQATVDMLRRLVSSAYEVAFPAGVELSQQVLLPTAADESNGMEDARFVRFVDDDGSVDYRATYTAYDGHLIAPRLLTSPDLRSFRADLLAGPAARNKGMALFPRRVGGRYLALCRQDGETNSLTSSPDGHSWSEPRLVQAPAASWEVLQVGNCGPPIETDRGWLVLTHGVGPMRTYAIGALLLDLDDPARVLARLDRPLLRPAPAERDGYVPNVVYSCGGLVHDGLLWLPYGIGDARIGVAWVAVEELLAQMSPVPP